MTPDVVRKSAPCTTDVFGSAEDRRRSTEDVTDLHERIERAERRAEKAEQRRDDHERAVVTRARIDQVEGILMSGFGLEPDDAFDVLVWLSQQTNTELVHVCDDILRAVRTVDVPDACRDEITAVLDRLLRRTA
ncbi:ANTAR domain-containing protein [Actinomycetospora chibensis]|uniref:ANTAR domain-containing protein n=1 Tax=Actinomycetospora chibensis TaxID=663606 RepID=A0ABV9RAS7_9PSEU|nr:ANTAR domain-containing protein [Actinomycetospora chibensis]MDD7922156.1 ANTAR domain-containing protein [Actinomycetospora chibensis]